MVDLEGSTVLPGFVDAHTHISSALVASPGWDQSRVRETAADEVLRGALHARQTLEAGYTTIREVGARGFTDVSLRNAIRKGYVPGPRMQVAAHALGTTGGHCDENGFVPRLFGFEPGIAEGIANGPDEIRSAIRYQVKYGADHIKMCATGGVMSVGDTAGAQQYTAEELRVAVETAHMLERKITAHAHGTEGIKAAVLAGVDSIEHGSLLDEEGARLMAQKGTVLVSTLMAGDAVVRMAKDGRLTGEFADEGAGHRPQHAAGRRPRPGRRGENRPRHRQHLRPPHDRCPGVRAPGRSRAHPHGGHPRRHPQRRAPARVGEGRRRGKGGRYADLVAVKGDPLQDIGVLRAGPLRHEGRLGGEGRPLGFRGPPLRPYPRVEVLDGAQGCIEVLGQAEEPDLVRPVRVQALGRGRLSDDAKGAASIVDEVDPEEHTAG